MANVNPKQRDSAKPGELAVFMVDTHGRCDDCGCTIALGDLVRPENGKSFCIDCADLGHLVYLPRGNVALTRRASKYSSLKAIVLHWSRRRKQYERQGILVEDEALRRAEEECDGDSAVRAARQERDRERREKQDQAYIARFKDEILRLFPGCPAETAETIARHACEKYSGRVGRSAAAKEFDENAILLAVRAHIRHMHTNYDDLLMSGWSRTQAREEIADEIQTRIDQWSRSK